MDKSKLNRFFLKESPDSERKEIANWLLNPENDLVIGLWMHDNWDLICSIDLENFSDHPDEKKIWLKIQEKISESGELREHNKPVSFPFAYKIKRIVAAAAILIAFISGLSYYFLFKNRTDKSLAKSQKPVPALVNDVAPPKNNNAVLTLADGRKIALDSADNGTLATQGAVDILKKPNGEIIYAGASTGNVTYNTLSVPKGSKPVELVLADGSLVWLNAASSITYPTAFPGKERRVNIIGEAYFEVAKNPNMPFYVSKDNFRIKVLGTHFNVNAYDDEKEVKVTLLEGLMSVAAGEKTKELHPRQQAQLSEKNFKISNDVDLDEIMAWKNGQFYFSGNDIRSIMRQIEKYYDVEVEYKDTIPYQFVAKISRQVNVSEFLKRLELTNLIHFQIEGKKIIVRK